MKYLRLVVLSLCIIQAQNVTIYAHAIRYDLGSGGTVIQALFDNHQPAKGLSVVVMAPQSFEKFQTGKTDINGRFVFFPDRAGVWEVLIFDHMGHRLEIEIPVNETMKVENSTKKDISHPYLRVLIGISIIVLFFGAMKWISSKEFVSFFKNFKKH